MTTMCVSRLRKELKKLEKDKEAKEVFMAKPLDTKKNIRTWHYVIIGPKDTAFEGGFYHGILQFPKDYPYKPPSIKMFTPNGRFKCNTKLCLSNSDFHPESWSPFWSVSNILIGFASFMCDASNAIGVGSLKTTHEQKKYYAKQSLAFNLKNPAFKALFPSLVTLYDIQHTATQEEQQQHMSAVSSDGMTSDTSVGGSRDNRGTREVKKRDHMWDWLIISLFVMLIGYGLKIIL